MSSSGPGVSCDGSPVNKRSASSQPMNSVAARSSARTRARRLVDVGVPAVRVGAQRVAVLDPEAVELVPRVPADRRAEPRLDRPDRAVGVRPAETAKLSTMRKTWVSSGPDSTQVTNVIGGGHGWETLRSCGPLAPRAVLRSRSERARTNWPGDSTNGTRPTVGLTLRVRDRPITVGLTLRMRDGPTTVGLTLRVRKGPAAGETSGASPGPGSSRGA